MHHLHADTILHHSGAWGLTGPMLIHLLSFCSSGHSALCSLSRGSNQLCSSVLPLAAFTPVTRRCVMVVLSLSSSPRCAWTGTCFSCGSPDFRGFRASGILNFPVRAPPPLFSHTLVFVCQASLIQASALRQRGSCFARGPCLVLLFTVIPSFMCLPGKVEWKYWMSNKV